MNSCSTAHILLLPRKRAARGFRHDPRGKRELAISMLEVACDTPYSSPRPLRNTQHSRMGPLRTVRLAPSMQRRCRSWFPRGLRTVTLREPKWQAGERAPRETLTCRRVQEGRLGIGGVMQDLARQYECLQLDHEKNFCDETSAAVRANPGRNTRRQGTRGYTLSRGRGVEKRGYKRAKKVQNECETTSVLGCHVPMTACRPIKWGLHASLNSPLTSRRALYRRC